MALSILGRGSGRISAKKTSFGSTTGVMKASTFNWRVGRHGRQVSLSDAIAQPYSRHFDPRFMSPAYLHTTNYLEKKPIATTQSRTAPRIFRYTGTMNSCHGHPCGLHLGWRSIHGLPLRSSGQSSSPGAHDTGLQKVQGLSTRPPLLSRDVGTPAHDLSEDCIYEDDYIAISKIPGDAAVGFKNVAAVGKSISSRSPEPIAAPLRQWRQNKWIPEEDAIIIRGRDHHPDRPSTFRLVATRINKYLKENGSDHERSPGNVHNRYKRLKGLPIERRTNLQKRPRKKWTEDEDSILLRGRGDDRKPQTPYKLLAIQINRHLNDKGHSHKRTPANLACRYQIITTRPPMTIATYYKTEFERIREIIEEVLQDESLAKDLQVSHARWPLAVDQMIIRGKEKKISSAIIAAHLPAKKCSANALDERWKLLKRGSGSSMAWTKEEEAFVLEQMSKGKSYEWVARHKPYPPRTEAAIRLRILRTRRNVEGTTKRPCFWTAEENRILKDGRAMGKTLKEISKDLPGRSLSGVRSHVGQNILQPYTGST